jgi:hypothetical protein
MLGRIFSILFLLLSVAIATREIPELYDLGDNPANDGQVFNWQGQTALRTTPRVESKERVLPAHTITFARIENVGRTSAVCARTGRDILRLVASLRT